MPLGTREMYLVIRARDEASRVLKNFSRNMKGMDDGAVAAMEKAQKRMQIGQALSSAGVGLAAAGAAGVAFFADATKAAIDYNQAASKTLTQIDDTGVKLEDIKRIGIDVARAIPAPFEQMQESLFDIFSSMDVGLADAEKLLTEFARASVAGQVDLQDAARGTIGILNAYDLGAQGVNRVNDVMFRLVQKGVGTYGEFSKSIGRATPSAVRAGQSIEDLAGMMAFLTRNGLSTQMAATSAARALDAFSHPQTVKRLGDMGVAVRNAKGEFLPIRQIIKNLAKELDGLSAPEKAKRLQELFKASGGTIQARRFIDPALKSFKDLDQLTKDMTGSVGSLDRAYNKMLKAEGTQIQDFKNQWSILRVEMGQALLPVVTAVAKAVGGLFRWFNNLDGGTKRTITLIAAGTAVFAVLAGVVLTLAGVFLMFQAGLVMAGTTLGAVLLPIAAVIAAIVAIGVAVYLIIKYWDEIKAATIKTWNWIKSATQATWDWIKQYIGGAAMAVWNALKVAWDAIVSALQTTWNFITSIWNAIVSTISTAVNAVVSVVKSVWGTFGGLITAYMKLILTPVRIYWALIKLAFTVALEIIKTVLLAAFIVIGTIVKASMQGFWSAIKTTWDIIVGVFKWAMEWIIKWMKLSWNITKSVTKTAWSLIRKYIVDPLVATWNFVSPWLGKARGKIREAWDWIKEKTKAAWDLFKKYIIEPVEGAFNGAVEFIDKIVEKINWLKDKVSSIGDGIRSGLNKLNPMKRFSPSINDQVQEGYNRLRQITLKGLQNIYKDTVKWTDKTRTKQNAKAIDNAKKLQTAARTSIDALKGAGMNRYLSESINDINKAQKAMADALRGRKPTKAQQKVINNLQKMEDKLIKQRSGLYNAARAMADGITLGMQDAVSPMARAIDVMVAQLQDAWKGATMPQSVQDQIEELKNQASTIQNFRNDLFKTLTKGTSLVGMDTGEDTVTGGGIVRNLAKLVSDIKLWSAGVRELAHRGLNPVALKEIVQAGPDALPTIRALLQGNTVQSVNSLMAEAFQISNQVADQLEKQVFSKNPPRIGGASQAELAALMAGAGTGPAAGTLGTEQTINVYTNEIDPRQSAQQLGYALAGRMG